MMRIYIYIYLNAHWDDKDTAEKIYLTSIVNWHGFKRMGITERMNGVQVI